jgi:hypothetical protein
MTRDEAEALLPFLANGTLEGAERAAVEAAVKADAGLGDELDALRAIRQTMQAEDAFSPAEMGLARLMRTVKAEDAKPHRPRPLLWQIAAGVLLAIVLAQAAFQLRGPDPGGYQLAGGAGPDFTVAFRPDATETDLRALLQDANVEIVSGPSALGLYGLALLDGATADDARAQLTKSDLIETLEAAPEP